MVSRAIFASGSIVAYSVTQNSKDKREGRLHTPLAGMRLGGAPTLARSMMRATLEMGKC
jgi:hypothetical protein